MNAPARSDFINNVLPISDAIFDAICCNVEYSPIEVDPVFASKKLSVKLDRTMPISGGWETPPWNTAPSNSRNVPYDFLPISTVMVIGVN